MNIIQIGFYKNLYFFLNLIIKDLINKYIKILERMDYLEIV